MSVYMHRYTKHPYKIGVNYSIFNFHSHFPKRDKKSIRENLKPFKLHACLDVEKISKLSSSKIVAVGHVLLTCVKFFEETYHLNRRIR